MAVHNLMSQCCDSFGSLVTLPMLLMGAANDRPKETASMSHAINFFQMATTF